MKALQQDMAWVEKQFFLAACKKLAAEKKKVDLLRKRLDFEVRELQKLDKKIHWAITRRALKKVKEQVHNEAQSVKRQLASLTAHEQQLKRHFAHDKHQLLKKERERIALTRRGFLVI